MTYWHMQLHPNDTDWRREEELIGGIGSKTSIGLSDKLLEKDSEVTHFRKNMSIGDIVLIRRGREILSLVEVIGEVEDKIDDDLSSLEWFRYKREVQVLDIQQNKSESEYFSSPKFLSKAMKGKKPYQYIQSWHKKISPSFYRKQEGLKLQKVYIQQYNMLNEFNISFDELVTVIAGINGSGKTTLLEYITNFSSYISDKDEDRSLIEFEMYNENTKESTMETLNYKNADSLESKYFEKNIIYFPTGTDLQNIKNFLPEYLYQMVWVDKMNVDDVYNKVREFIDGIFKELNMMIEFDSVDFHGNLFFRNKKGKHFSREKEGKRFSIDKISTGEKTLLSKILYLYIKNIQNKVILIDEPELSLHPAWQNRVLKLYKNFAEENNCQIIIATHSPHIIGSAKNEYIRLLTLNKENEVEIINNVLAYGRDIEWILEKVMGASYTRDPIITKKIEECQELLNDEKYDEAEKLIDALEEIIGGNDREVMALRNSLEFWRE